MLGTTCPNLTKLKSLNVINLIVGVGSWIGLCERNSVQKYKVSVEMKHKTQCYRRSSVECFQGFWIVYCNKEATQPRVDIS
jgi:hypothetical protein